MYLQKDSLYHSVLYGSGVYYATPDAATDPISREQGASFTNTLHGESFFARAFGRNLEEEEVDNYKKLVLSPPDIKNILWPKDFVEIGEGQAVEGVVRLDNIYEHSEKEKVVAKDYVFLFSDKACPESIDLEKYLKQIKHNCAGSVTDRSQWQNYRNPEILTLAKDLVEKIDMLNREGYLYLDFHPSRLRIVNRELYLDFSNLIYDMEDVYKRKVANPGAEKLPIEFIAPELYSRQKKRIDFGTQNYSLASILFYLLVGRNAYDGRLRATDIDDSLYNHYRKFENMIEQPIFIFDKQDEANHPEDNTIGQALLERWGTYPKLMRYMFIKALSRKVEYGQKLSYRYHDELPTPRQWINLLYSL